MIDCFWSFNFSLQFAVFIHWKKFFFLWIDPRLPECKEKQQETRSKQKEKSRLMLLTMLRATLHIAISNPFRLILALLIEWIGTKVIKVQIIELTSNQRERSVLYPKCIKVWFLCNPQLLEGSDNTSVSQKITRQLAYKMTKLWKPRKWRETEAMYKI